MSESITFAQLPGEAQCAWDRDVAPNLESDAHVELKSNGWKPPRATVMAVPHGLPGFRNVPCWAAVWDGPDKLWFKGYWNYDADNERWFHSDI